MDRFTVSSSNGRSLLRPRSDRRFLAGLALAAAAPAAAAILSSHAPRAVAALTLLAAVALAALVGRIGPGLLSLALAATLLAIRGGTPAETSTADAAGLASLALVVVLGAALAWGIPRLELAARAVLTLDAHGDYERTRKAAERNEILQRLATALSRSVSLTDVVETVLVEGVRAMAAQSALIAVLSEDSRTLEVLGQHGYDPRDLSRWSTFPVSAALPMAEAVRTRSSVIVHDEADKDRRFPLLSSTPMGHHSLVCLPLVAGGEVVGGMSVAFPMVRPFSDGDEGFLMAVASMTGQAMRRATLYETERTTSRLLQESLLPRQLPTIPGLRFAARYWASGRDAAVGGDFYDVVDSPGGCMALIGDVCGRGVEAAAVMGIARHAAWSAAETESSPAAVLTVVNDVLRRRVDDYRFVTMCAVLLEPVEDWFAATVTCAGHPLPVRIAQGAVEPVGLTGMLLGIYEDPPLREQRVRLAPSESLVLHTDGVVERGGSHVPFAEDETLTRAVREAGSDAEQVARSIETVLMSGHPLVDDAAVLVVSAGG
jgi:hypothetical protein